MGRPGWWAGRLTAGWSVDGVYGAMLTLPRTPMLPDPVVPGSLRPASRAWRVGGSQAPMMLRYSSVKVVSSAPVSHQIVVFLILAMVGLSTVRTA